MVALVGNTANFCIFRNPSQKWDFYWIWRYDVDKIFMGAYFFEVDIVLIYIRSQASLCVFFVYKCTRERTGRTDGRELDKSE